MDIFWKKYENLRKHGHRPLFEGVRRGAPLPFSFKEFSAIVYSALAIGRCHHCMEVLNLNNFSPDHMTAISEGGRTILSNIRIICWPCNNEKKSMSDKIFHRLKAKDRLRALRESRAKRGTSEALLLSLEP